MKDLKSCLICGVALERSGCVAHSHLHSHAVEVCKLLSRPHVFHSVMADLRPTQETRHVVALCYSRVQAALRPEQVYLTGSWGKKTALRNEHDLDMAVVLPGGASDENLHHATSRLLAEGFENVYVQRRRLFGKRLLVAAFHGLSVDISLIESLDLGSWGADAVQDTKFFTQRLSPGAQDLVRMMKALFRLRFPEMPGIALEIAALQLPSSSYAVHDHFLELLQLFKKMPDLHHPVTNEKLRRGPRRAEIAEYCEELLSLRQGAYDGSLEDDAVLSRHVGSMRRRSLWVPRPFRFVMKVIKISILLQVGTYSLARMPDLCLLWDRAFAFEPRIPRALQLWIRNLWLAAAQWYYWRYVTGVCFE